MFIFLWKRTKNIHCHHPFPARGCYAKLIFNNICNPRDDYSFFRYYHEKPQKRDTQIAEHIITYALRKKKEFGYENNFEIKNKNRGHKLKLTSTMKVEQSPKRLSSDRRD